MQTADSTTETISEFISTSGVTELLAQFKKTIALNQQQGKPFVVSDVSDAAGNQYVDLVQEGGGVWGIALLGYTYILEKVGIRFFSLAGTSAGAINTMLMATAANKEEEKSEKIIEYLLALDLFSFVDGKKDNWRITRWVKKIIQKFIAKPGYLKGVKRTVIIFLLLLCFFSIATFITSFFLKLSLLKWLSATALFLWVLCLGFLLFFVFRIKKLIKHGYGLNEGNVFYHWMEGLLQKHRINNLADLKNHFNKLPFGLKVTKDAVRDALLQEPIEAPQHPVLIIVASDITTGNKVEFPRMWDLYWKILHDVPPAAFVRASMSIPFFFETYKIKVAPTLRALKTTWKNHLNWTKDIPFQVEMVDGGVLSNFPINVFYQSKYIIPRMPTFGIRLGTDNENEPNSLNSLASYINSLINTIRSTTDKEFLNKYKAFSLGVQTVDLTGHSWLNFFIDQEEKKQLFRKGAEAAISFLQNFNWENYKKERFQNAQLLAEQETNPNNW